MKTHITPIYLILGLMAVATFTIGASAPKAATVARMPTVRSVPAAPAAYEFELKTAKALAFQATSPGMAMPASIVVIHSDKLDAQIEKRVADAIAQAARARRKAG